MGGEKVSGSTAVVHQAPVHTQKAVQQMSVSDGQSSSSKITAECALSGQMANGDSGIVVEAVGSDSAWSVGTSSRSAVQQRALSDDGHTWGSGVSVDSAAIGNRLTPALPNWTNTGGKCLQEIMCRTGVLSITDLLMQSSLLRHSCLVQCRVLYLQALLQHDSRSQPCLYSPLL